MQDTCHVNFIVDLARHGVSVAQCIGAQNLKVWGSIPRGDWEIFFVPRLWQDENIFLHKSNSLSHLQAYQLCPQVHF